jgi:hypothetical protein
MAQYNFGTGGLYLVDASSPAQATQVGVLKDVSLDISFDTKELRGSYTFPVDVARAGGKIEGSASFAQISGRLINAILGGTQTAGATVIGSNNEAGTVPATPYAITVANTTGWSDLGVYNVTNSKFMTRVASSPATGQYSATAGVYTFAAADTTNSVQISYSYTSATANTVTLTNALMGSGTTYQILLFNTYKSKNVGVKLYAATLGKYSFSMPNEDFSEETLDFMGFADASSNVISVYTTE